MHIAQKGLGKWNKPLKTVCLSHSLDLVVHFAMS